MIVSGAEAGEAVYRLTRGWMWFLAGTGAALAAAGIAGLGNVWLGEGTDPRNATFWSVIALLGILSGAVIVATIMRTRVTIGPDFVEYHNGFVARRMRTAQCTGFRIERSQNPPAVVLLPGQGVAKELRIPMMYRFDAGFHAWLARFDDLDRKELQAEQEAIASNAGLGQTPVERGEAAARFARNRGWLVAGALGLTLWLLLYPRPLALLVLLSLAFTALAFAEVHFEARRGYESKDNPPYFPVEVLGLMLAFRAFDVKLVDWTAIVIPTLVGGAVATMLLRANRSGAKALLSMAAMLLPFAAGMLVLVNVVLDQATPATFAASVKSKLEGGGKSRQLTLYLAPSAQLHAIGKFKVNVDHELYDQTQAGNAVCILVHQGALGIAWYDVQGIERCAPASR